MLAVVGTVPEPSLPVLEGKATMEGDAIVIDGKRLRVGRGTTALLAAAIQVAILLDQPLPHAYLAGDIGTGEGSLKLYAYLTEKLGQGNFRTIAFHYILPDVDWHNRVLLALDAMEPRPLLIADAGWMYVAKMSGQAPSYDLFTPDAGELAFLADEKAPHPFYTRGFLLKEENRVPELIERAYRNEDASRCMLVKGTRDFVATKQGIFATINGPTVEAMEAIGGTGDTLSGMAAALVASGRDLLDAAQIAARANRVAGVLTRATPATQIHEIIGNLPRALEQVLGLSR